MSEPATLQILQRQALDLRNKAEALRTHGESLRTTQARRILIDLAADADRMAEHLEARMRAFAVQLER